MAAFVNPVTISVRGKRQINNVLILFQGKHVRGPDGRTPPKTRFMALEGDKSVGNYVSGGAFYINFEMS